MAASFYYAALNSSGTAETKEHGVYVNLRGMHARRISTRVQEIPPRLMFTIVYGKSARGIFPNLCGVEKDHLELTKEKLVEDPYRNSKPLKGKKYKGARNARFGRHRILFRVDPKMAQVTIVGGDDRGRVFTLTYTEY
ncbi:hypothetical protein TNCT_101341 [Trichonephila clavata]|uniref:Uncharacterized protein n=1 Tax=Trichonephila clavata TaxID=2740835 RepID=A0A8X6I3N5_TRICU|nr:hypothetical protein TNCT_101341 [Trichonephila clavata]